MKNVNMPVIEKTIYLPPKFLDRNIMDHLLSELRVNINKCSDEHGHILSVNKILSIVENRNTMFKLLFDVDTLKPTDGGVFSSSVCMIYKDGVFVTIKNCQKVLIPSSYMSSYVYDEINNIYSNTDTHDTINLNDILNVQIKASKYNNGNFSCIGTIV